MRQVLAILTLALLASACSKPKPEDKVIGTWFGDPPEFAQFRKSADLGAFADVMKDSVRLDLASDHTYKLRYFLVKRGNWRLRNRLVTFDETDSKSTLPFMSGEVFDFGKPTASGTRSYSAILSDGDKTLTLLLGPKLQDIAFHR